jgi:hypothetical protein
MQSLRSNKRQRKLRKQKPVRRLESASALSLPRLQVPRTARRRRRRNSRLRLPSDALKRLVLSARWISLLLLAITLSALALIGMDENFYLTMIPVEGVASIPPSEIVNASGLAGAHVFSVEPRAAAQQIAELPGVISATVTLEWPNQAHVRIGEDSPVAVWEQDGQTYWVNEQGDLAPARLEAPGLLRIKVEDSETDIAPDPAPEETVASDEDAADTQPEAQPALFVPDDVLQGALLLRQLRPNIDALFYGAGGGLSYQDGRGWRAYFGTGTDMGQKLVVYETLVEHLEAKGVTPAYISVSNQETPYYLAR